MNSSQTSAEVVKQFVACINAHNPEALAALMMVDHCFIDSLGQRINGRAAAQAAWTGYFGLIADYQIAVGESLTHESVVVLFGQARGSYQGNGWETPLACRAAVRDGQIAEWRVYADNEPLRHLMRQSP
jgi:ketosteroid isomerase-like protein